MPGNEAQKRHNWAKRDAGLPIAMSSITTSAIDTPARRSVERTCDDLAILVLAVVGIVAGLTFRDYGLGWDDYTHAEYADLLLRMYGSGFKDTGALSFANLYMYGGGFDMAAALLHKVIPLELFETRRLLGAIVGVIGLAVTWRLARRVGGPLAGLAALLLLALCPTFYGHMFMNPKDAPFAVAMVILMLGLVRLAEEYPAAFAADHPDRRPRRRPVDRFAYPRRARFDLRAGRLRAVVRGRDSAPTARAKPPNASLHVVYVLLPGLILGYLVMGLIWPWSIMEPDNPFQALTYFSHFFEKPWKEMFDGALVSVPDMPWSYLPTLFALQLPEVLLALSDRRRHRHVRGAAAPRRSGPPQDHPADADVGGNAAAGDRDGEAPGALQRHPPFHFRDPADDGARRHRLRLGNELARGKSPQLATCRLAVFAFGLLLPLGEMIRLHPYQYTHFNHIAGTVRGADDRFMLDYWGLALKQASDGLREQIAERQEVPPQGRKWKVAVCGPQRPAQVALGPDFTIGWDSHAADFAMTLGEFYCKGLTAPVLVEIKRDDVVFARVYDIRGRSISSLLAIPAP